MYTRESISNLVLGALLLSKEIANYETDQSKEAKVIRRYFDIGYRTALIDMDLDSTSSQKTLELIEEEPNTLWLYSYKYPQDCAHFRRIQTGGVIDNRETHIPKRVVVNNGVKCIFTDQADAIIEYISTNVPIPTLSAPAGLAVAYQIASLCTPFIVGKGAKTLRAQIDEMYKKYKTEAQEHDRNENFHFVDEATESEFVRARTS